MAIQRARSTRISTSSGSLIAAVIVVAVGLPLLLAAATGSISIPHNDAWSHSRIGQTWGEHGRIELLGWNRSSLLGQIVVLGPVARWIVAQHLFVAACGVVALLATFDLVARHRGRSAGILAAATLGVFPGFGLLATSFMTDVPALAATTTVLALGDRAIVTRSTSLLWAATAAGFWGVTIREQVIAAPAAVLICAYLGWRGRSQARQVVAAAITLVVAVAVFEGWRRGLSGDDPPTSGLVLRAQWADLARVFFSLGLIALPVTLAVVRPRSWGLWRWSAVAGVAALGAGFVVLQHEAVVLGNYLTPHGAYDEASAGSRAAMSVVMGVPLWRIITVVAIGATALLTGALLAGWRGLRSVPPLTTAFTVLIAVGTIVQTAMGQGIFDRYLLPLVPAIAIVLFGLHSPLPRPRATAIAGVAALALLSTLVTANAMAFDAARWETAERLEQDGSGPMEIDAGLEWLGWHSAAGMTENAPSPVESGASPWVSRIPDARDCLVIASSPLDRGALVERTRYRRFGLLGRAQLFIYDVGGC